MTQDSTGIGKACIIPDIYFDERYGKLYEAIEHGICKTFEYQSESGTIRHMFIKRKIDIDLQDGQTYYDIVTPYGYGGPVILQCQGDRKALVDEYTAQFAHYCEQEKIISEFIRFHPLLNNADDFRSVMTVENIRNTVGTNLTISDDPIQTEYSKYCRKNIRKALKNGVTYTVEHAPEDIMEFMQFYYLTMDRNDAADYYYFDEKYFRELLKELRQHIVCAKVFYEGKLIAMNICFAYGEYVHIHLSGSLVEYLRMSPNYVLEYAICEWAIQHGYQCIHHGGGRSNDEHDKLFEFKRQFGQNTLFQFSVGKKVWDKAVYDKLTERAAKSSPATGDNTNYFPAYRR